MNNLLDFHSLKNNKYDKSIIVDFIKNAHTLSDIGHYKKRLTSFGYGTDEIFINQFIKNNIEIISSQMEYNPNWFIFNNLETIKTNKFSFNIFKYLFGSYYNKQSLDHMITEYDKIFYKLNKKNDQVVYLCERFYKLLKYMIKNNIEWINMNDMKLIYKYFNNIVFTVGFLKVNLKTKKLIDIELYHPTYI